LKAKFNIRVVFGWLLLLVFSFSITPKQLLHDVLADHTDLSIHSKSKAPAVGKTGFSCDRLNLVAESPFIPAEKKIETVQEKSCTDFIVISDPKVFPRAVVLPALRGPPCM
jgi:hypothetical protein